MTDDIPAQVFETIDDIALRLRELRARAGEPSYAEISRRVAEQRKANGASDVAATPARTTVYDVFRVGRTRVNYELVGEVALALDASSEVSEHLARRARSAGPSGRNSPTFESPRPDTQLDGAHRSHLQLPRYVFVALVLAGCIGINLFGDALTDKFQLVLWLDMIGTAVAAIALGPWHGAFVGLLTNLLGTLDGNVETLPFALVNIVGALVWGYGYHRFGGNRGPFRFLLLALTVAVSCTLVAAPLTMIVFGGQAAYAGDSYAARLAVDGIPLSGAVFLVNLALSVVDKLLASYAAIVVARPLGDIRADHRTAITI